MGVNMKKVLIILGLGICMAGCDGDANIDISTYPDAVRRCYNNIIYNDKNCTKSKKTIVKYCECYDAKSTALAAELDADWNHVRGVSGFIRDGIAKEMLRDFDTGLEKIANSCAEMTGYTRIQNCNK